MTDEFSTELSSVPFPSDEEEPWRVVDGLADWRAMPPLTPTPPTTAMPFATEAEPLRRDTLETPADVQRHIPTVMQMPALTLTTEVKRPALTRLVPAVTPPDADREERLLVRLVVGAVVLAFVVFVATLLWPTSAPPPQRLPERVLVPPPAPQLSPAPPPPVLDDLALDPRLHRVDTLAVHVPDLPTEPRHRYLVSIAQLPRGATVAARLDDVKEGFGPLFGIAPGRVLAVHGVKHLRFHCEPPETFTAQSTLELQVQDTTTKQTTLVSLRPWSDCLDVGAGRTLRLSEPQRLSIPDEARQTMRIAFRAQDALGNARAGMLSPGHSVRLEPGVVQVAAVSHTVPTFAPVRLELLPADVESPRQQAQYLTPSLTPVREAPAPRPPPRRDEPDIWPRSN
ncbi:MAG: hypothetical protein GQE15_11745 [Archangiaceae bacterium]|nr:hypothetical protein [Archangiaceae bacterium]